MPFFALYIANTGSSFRYFAQTTGVAMEDRQLEAGIDWSMCRGCRTGSGGPAVAVVPKVCYNHSCSVLVEAPVEDREKGHNRREEELPLKEEEGLLVCYRWRVFCPDTFV